MAIKDNIKMLRKRYGLTQQELAEIAGVTNKAVWAWENGLSEPRMGAIERIAAHFNLKKSNIIEEGGGGNRTLIYAACYINVFDTLVIFACKNRAK